MVTVVSDAGPLIHLSQINKLDLLKKLFGVVFITDSVKVEVFDEGIELGHADAKAIGKALADGWLKTAFFPQSLARSAAKLEKAENISQTDAETLLLAVDKKAVLLVDEKLLANLAKMYGLKVWDTWTILLQSLREDYLELNGITIAINELRKTKFTLNEKQAQELLADAKVIEKHKSEKINKQKFS